MATRGRWARGSRCEGTARTLSAARELVRQRRELRELLGEGPRDRRYWIERYGVMWRVLSVERSEGEKLCR